MQKINYSKKTNMIFYAVLALFEAYSIIYLLGATGILFSFCLILLPAFYYFEKKVNTQNKIKYNFVIFSLIFGGCVFFGRIYFSEISLRFYSSALFIFFSKFIYNCSISAGSLLDNLTSEIKEEKKGTLKFFFLFWIIIFAAWLPYLLGSLPGVLTYDSIKQINMALGNIPITDQHPILHTLIIKVCLWLGGGSPIIYSLIQMLFLSAVFSFTLIYMRSKGTKYRLTLPIITAWYALNPLHAVYSVNMQKDTFFGGAVLLLTIALYQITITNGECLKKAKWLALFIVSVLLVCFLRNNGPYVLLLLIPVLFLSIKKQRKQIALTFLIFIVSLFVVKTVIYNTFDIQKSSFAESVGVPLQQISRVIYDGEKITEGERKALEKFISVEDIKNQYTPNCVDPLKSELYGGGLNHRALNENKGEFLGLWLRLLIKHPKSYVRAYLDETSGYWYPFCKPSYISNWAYVGENDLGISTSTLSGSLTARLKHIISLCFNQKIPVFSVLFGMAFMAFAVLYLALYSLKSSNYKKLIPFLPVLILWLSVLISAPISDHLRYLYPVFTCIPLLAGFALKRNNG